MKPSAISFSNVDSGIEIMRISKNGIWANPSVPVEETAQLVIKALQSNINCMVQQAVLEEREACAKIADEWATIQQKQFGNGGPGAAIRARGAS